MSSLQEAIFERLYTRYRTTFDEPFPIHLTSVDDAIAYMRSRLRAYANETAKTLGTQPPAPLIRNRDHTAAGERAAA